MIPSFRLGIIAAAIRRASGPISDVLLHYEGATVVDSGIHALTVTNYGASVSTAQHKFGTQSLLTATCVGVSNAVLAPGTGDFKFESWVYITNNGGQQFFFDQRNPGGMCLYHNGGRLYYYDGSNFDTGVSVPLNSWHHVECDRASGVVYVFLDGTLVGTFASSGNFTNPQWIIGAAQYFPIGVNQLLGYMDETRIRVGVGAAEHTTSFTPPTSAYLP